VVASVEKPSEAAEPREVGTVEDRGLKSEGLVLDWWDACQVVFVFVATQYIVSWGADSLSPIAGASAFKLIADQLAVAVFPVACLFRLQPWTLDTFRGPRPSRGVLLVITVASLPLICLLKATTSGPVFTTGLPVIAAIYPPHYATIVGLLVTCIAGPAIEEIFFRGILGRNLILRYGFLRGMLLTAALFAVIRLDRFQLAPAFLLSVACTLLYYKIRSIYAPILLQGLTSCFGQSINSIDNDRPLLFTAVLAVSALGYVILEGHFQSPDGQLPAALPLFPGYKLRLPVLSPVAALVVVFLAPFPFYVIAFTHVVSHVFR
jgi:membrane protease YdiL (CAAX protease family)